MSPRNAADAMDFEGILFDHVIVGGGSAGCVLASRLSEPPSRRVLLIEAGPDLLPGREPEDVRAVNPMRAYANPAYKWPGLCAYMGRAEPGLRPNAYEQARVIGGGSSINAQVANRGAPEDYDAWEAAGAVGWGWEGVLPYFLKIEHDMDFAGPWHGKGGPLPVTRLFPEDWSGFVKGVAAALGASGFAYVEDMNADFACGFTPIPMTSAFGRRVSSAIAYLGPAVRRRPNLEIVGGAEAVAVRFEGRRAVAVEAHGRSGPRRIAGREIVLACGAVHSPALLMRSGIGPGEQLRRLGIPVVASLPGVGASLRCHPTVTVSAYLPRAARAARGTGRYIQIALRYSSGHPACPSADMYVSVAARSGWHPVGWRLGTLQLWPNRVYSAGSVALASADWRTPPIIAFDFLSDRRDLARLADGIRFLARLFGHESLRQASRDPFPTHYGDRVKRVGRISAANWLKAAAAAALMDGPGALRRLVIRSVIMPGPTLADLLADDGRLESYVRGAISPTGHVSCTCRMGRADDPMAVTDPEGRVRGLDGLRVADASVMPDLPRANTNVPTVMIAEKLADAMRGRAGEAQR